MLDVNSPLEDQEQELLSACPSLITVVNGLGSRVVQFSHFSVKEFLMSDRLSASGEDISRYHIHPDVAHTTIAQTCLEVLLRLDDRVDRWSAWTTLAGYAAKCWVFHVQVAKTSSHIMRMMETLFDSDKPHFAVWIRIYDLYDLIWFPDWDTAPLYYAALFGFYKLVEQLVKKNPGHVNTLGGVCDYPLVAALYKGHIQVANLLLQHGANLDVRGAYGRTPLHRAITWLDETVVSAVRFLLEHGADANPQREDYRTPLHLAAAWGNHIVTQILLQTRVYTDQGILSWQYRFGPAPILNHFNLVQLMLEHGANIHAEDEHGWTPLHHAARNTYISAERSNVAQLLIERGADVNKRDKYQQTPLHFASHHQHLDVVRVLLDHGANVNTEDRWGRSPLRRALNNSSINDDSATLVQLLAERGADVNKHDENHMTLLHVAADHQHLKLVQVLLNHGANVNAKNICGWTPLHQVLHIHKTSEDVIRIVQLLEERGADVNTPTKGHVIPLHIASRRQCLELVRVLLNLGANVNAEADDGRTSLHFALLGSLISEDGIHVVQSEGGVGVVQSNDCIGVVQLLLDRGANVNAPEKYHVTPLHIASKNQSLELVRVLLNHGANVNAEDSYHRTPLHRVFEIHNTSEDVVRVVQLLAERGADVNAPNNLHEIPLHLASHRQCLELVRVLLDLGAIINAEDGDGRTSLHRVLTGPSLSEDGVRVVQLLLERGANANAQEKHHVTPLHLASYCQQLESVQVLLNHGANVNAEDSHHRTPLHRVLECTPLSEDGFGVVQLLVELGADVNPRDMDY